MHDEREKKVCFLLSLFSGRMTFGEAGAEGCPKIWFGAVSGEEGEALKGGEGEMSRKWDSFSFSLYQRVRHRIRESGMLKKGDRVKLALSGGADSVFLAILLKELSEELSLELSACHVNHGIRGEEAEHDQHFCENLCRQFKIPLSVKAVDVLGYAHAHHMGTEEAGRLLRYRALREGFCGKIAVAHHSNDQAETVLQHLFRGTGLRGMAGMEEIHGAVIRPLLYLSREEIRKSLELRGIPYCTDSSNFSEEYARNRIRQELLPIGSSLYPGAVSHILEASISFREAEELLTELAREYLRGELPGIFSKKDFFRVGSRCEEKEFSAERAEEQETEKGEEESVISLSCRTLRAQRAILRRYIYREVLLLLCHSEKDIERAHFAALDHVLLGGKGGHSDLPYHITVDRTRDGIVFSRHFESLSMRRRKGHGENQGIGERRGD